MKTFNVYKHPTKGFEAVKVGFSWPAFFFGFIWMYAKGLLWLAGLWFVLIVIQTVIGANASGVQILAYFALTAASFVLWLVTAVNGNEWCEKNLSKRGYELLSTVQAKTPDEAIVNWAKSV